MPGGRGKPKRACGMCKMYKYMGNSKGRHKPKEEAKRKDMKEEASPRSSNG